MSLFFLFFALSGFCSILYELIWLRLAMAQFGVTTPLVSVVLSMFMAGIGIGSWAAGTAVCRFEKNVNFRPLRLYAWCEFSIAISALLVPMQFSWGHSLLQRVSGQTALSSNGYYLAAGLWLAVTLVPWCACMGATTPLVMAAIRNYDGSETPRSFSFLYLANLTGAVAGALVPLLFIELRGFNGTLRIGALVNVAVATSAALLSLFPGQFKRKQSSFPNVPVATVSRQESPERLVQLCLFLTGFASMGMEVVWLRLFTPSVGPFVYSFACILASYLFATFFGSRAYRAWTNRHTAGRSTALWLSLPLLGLLPLLTTDFRLQLAPWTRVLLGVVPFCAVVGYLTPMLVDRWSLGDPARAGRAYAVNVLGCILGPLSAGFLLLPLFGERTSLLMFLLPFFAVAGFPFAGLTNRPVLRLWAWAVVLSVVAVFTLPKPLEKRYLEPIVLRDNTATVIGATEPSTKQKTLLVNGIVMTELTVVTKMMAHLTLASHEEAPQSSLVICFGMGTTFRSSLSWGVPTVVVDLVPSVPKLFPYFHRDAAQVVASPLAKIITDDGRRYLERSSATFDSIIVDPPPPVPAAASSLLYSEEFYALVKQHLRHGGIFQQWLPMGDRATQAAVARSLQSSFPYVRVFEYKGTIGWHYLASMQPIPARTPAELAARLPARAAADLAEWNSAKTLVDQFANLREIGLDSQIRLSPSTPPLRDDRPINEYYLLRTPCLSCDPAVEWARQHLAWGVSRIVGSTVGTTLH